MGHCDLLEYLMNNNIIGHVVYEQWLNRLEFVNYSFF